MLLKKKIGVSLGATLKLDPGDPKCYEFLRLDVTYEEELAPQTSVSAKYKEAWATVEEELSGAFAEMRNKLKGLQEKE